MTISIMRARLFNLSLRGFTQLGRLLLLLALARFLEPAEVGLYGLVFALVNYGIMAVGLDFYAFANRELVDADAVGRRKIMENQMSVYLAGYAIVLPLSLLLVARDTLTFSLLSFCWLLLIAEHLSYEVYRALSAVGKPVAAGWVAFLRSAVWVPILCLVYVVLPVARALEVTLLFWLIGAAVSVIFALRVFTGLGVHLRRPRFNKGWILVGLGVAAPYIIGTLAIRGIFTLDRFTVEALAGLAVLGAYTFYAGIAVTMLGLLESSVFNFIYPKMVRSANRHDVSLLRRQMLSLTIQTVTVTLALTGLVFLFAPYLLRFAGRAIYLENLDLMYSTVAAFGLYCLTMVPHYGLFALRADRSIMYAHLSGVITFVLALLALSGSSLGARSVPYAMMCSFTVILLFKTTLYLQKYEIFKASGPIHV